MSDMRMNEILAENTQLENKILELEAERDKCTKIFVRTKDGKILVGNYIDFTTVHYNPLILHHDGGYAALSLDEIDRIEVRKESEGE